MLDGHTRHIGCFLGGPVTSGASRLRAPEINLLVGVHVFVVEDTEDAREVLNAALH